MGIKLKNKYLYIISLLISIYMLSISLMSASDFINNRTYISKDAYFHSFSFENDLSRYYESVRYVEDRGNHIIAKEKGQYDNAKKYIASAKSIKYYFKDKKSKQVHTNLENVTDVNSYIKNNALYTEKFPKEVKTGDFYQTINYYFQTNNFEGEFIVLNDSNGYSQLHEDIKYYNSIRKRVIIEGILFGVSLCIGIFLLLYILKKVKDNILYTEKIRIIYSKIPIDLRIVMFIIYSAVMWKYEKKVNFFIKPVGINHAIKLTLTAIFVLYLIFNIFEVKSFKKNPNDFVNQFKNSFIYEYGQIVRDSFKIRKTIRKINIIILLTIILGMVIIIIFYGLVRRNEVIFFISAIYILLYIAFIPLYVKKKIVYLSKIMKGTDEITSGNLNYLIEEKGNDGLYKLAHNINNMKSGFKKSLESQMKSERLKSELITNVSHDLKTPLTSIINYTNILKNQNLSIEENNACIDILDKKSQRLKILIDDLFEASKMASGTVEFHIERVDIVALLKQALGEFDEKIKKSSLSFKFNTKKQNIYLNLDGNKTWRVFDNLLNNIIKYSQPDTRVYIDISEEESAVKIIMKNISAYEMDFDVEEIFDRFKRGDKSRNTEGSGLGLAIAKSIVEQQGGKLNIEIDGDLFKSTIEFRHK